MECLSAIIGIKASPHPPPRPSQNRPFRKKNIKIEFVIFERKMQRTFPLSEYIRTSLKKTKDEILINVFKN